MTNYELHEYVKTLFVGHEYGSNDIGANYFDKHILGVVAQIYAMKDIIIQDLGESNYYKAVQVAYLHDVIEDTNVKYEELKEIFGDGIANTVMILSKTPGMSYIDYIKGIIASHNEVALYVKLADLNTNIKQCEEDMADNITTDKYYFKTRKDKYEAVRYIIRGELGYD